MENGITNDESKAIGRFIMEVWLNDRKLEYRESPDESYIDSEMFALKTLYKNKGCKFYKGFLINVD